MAVTEKFLEQQLISINHVFGLDKKNSKYEFQIDGAYGGKKLIFASKPGAKVYKHNDVSYGYVSKSELSNFMSAFIDGAYWLKTKKHVVK